MCFILFFIYIICNLKSLSYGAAVSYMGNEFYIFYFYCIDTFGYCTTSLIISSSVIEIPKIIPWSSIFIMQSCECFCTFNLSDNLRNWVRFCGLQVSVPRGTQRGTPGRGGTSVDSAPVTPVTGAVNRKKHTHGYLYWMFDCHTSKGYLY